MKKQETNDPNVIRNNFTEIGMSIDKARQSKILNNHFKVFMIDYINSDGFNMAESVKQYAIELIEENWDNPDYKFEDSFAALEETANMAEDIKDMDFETMKTTLINIVKNQNSKEALKKALESGIIDDLSNGSETKTDVMNELLLSFMGISSESENTEKDVDATIKAGNEISDLIDASESQSKEFEFDGETEADKKKDSVAMMENISGSTVVMNLISNENSSTAKMMDGIVIDEDIVSYGIDNANISNSNKEALRKFFNIA